MTDYGIAVFSFNIANIVIDPGDYQRMIAAKKGVAVGAGKGGKLKTILYIATSFLCLVVDSLIRCGIDVSAYTNVCEIIITTMSILCVVASYGSFADYIHSFKTLFFDKN